MSQRGSARASGASDGAQPAAGSACPRRRRRAGGQPRARVGTRRAAGSKDRRGRERGAHASPGDRRSAAPDGARGEAGQRRPHGVTAPRAPHGPAGASGVRRLAHPRPFTHPCAPPQPRQPSPRIPGSTPRPQGLRRLPARTVALGSRRLPSPACTGAPATYGWRRESSGLGPSGPGSLFPPFGLQFPACPRAAPRPRADAPTGPSRIRAQTPAPKMASVAAGTR